MSDHTEKRDGMADRIAYVLSLARGIGTTRMLEPNLIEVTADDGTAYTLRVCQKRNQPNRRK
jgi:ribosomal protein L28